MFRRELAHQVGVVRQAISQLEAPDSNVTLGTLMKLDIAIDPALS